MPKEISSSFTCEPGKCAWQKIWDWINSHQNLTNTTTSALKLPCFNNGKQGGCGETYTATGTEPNPENNSAEERICVH